LRRRGKNATKAQMTDFVLDPQLEADTYTLGCLELSRVLLMNDARYPWLILVPEQAGLAEIIDLPEPGRMALMREIATVSDVLKRLYDPDKLNVGALGNRVRQLHVHVLARFVSDSAWPGPVWGVGQAQPYPAHLAGMTMDRIAAALKPHGFRECT
jgi:diadenosine tetraphosphate (Ap4A) HIT family hydrolase